MKAVISTLLILIGILPLNAQVEKVLNQEAGPKEGINQLALKYFGIDFSKEQRKEIDEVEIELIFLIDETGSPTLSEINGVSNPDIIDSLKRKTSQLENFNPQVRDGVAQSSIYFMKLIYPRYKMNQRSFGLLQGSAYNQADLDDFESIVESGQRLDMLFGGFMNQFLGKPSKYLTLGGGMKLDLCFTTSNQMFYGMNMSFSGNGLKKDYPINSQREQTAPVSGIVGLTVGKWMSSYAVQFDLGLAVHNITKKIGDDDPEWVQLNGWSPGIVFNYPILLGKEKPIYYYGSPSLLGNNLNLSFGLRYMKYSLREASGLMAELGIGYRMGLKGIKEYKLKDEFYTR